MIVRNPKGLCYMCYRNKKGSTVVSSAREYNCKQSLNVNIDKTKRKNVLVLVNSIDFIVKVAYG